jgi:hypothetical protein
MYHFLHKHRYWFAALVVIAAVAIFFFQIRDDGGLPAGADNSKQPLTAPSERLPIGK